MFVNPTFERLRPVNYLESGVTSSGRLESFIREVDLFVRGHVNSRLEFTVVLICDSLRIH